jgi:omega-6 fatty acid desaturase (delta-12 desaturase)
MVSGAARQLALRSSCRLALFHREYRIHQVHHLCSRIPFYRLPQALREHPDLARIGRISLGESLRCVRLALWDETSRRLISFRELQTRDMDGSRADAPHSEQAMASRAGG